MAERGTALERETLVIRGVRSELLLEAGSITIVKEATTQATPTRVEIPVATVRGSTLDAPRRGGGRGWLHIASTNGSPAPVGELAASGDPYALPITAKNVGAARKLAKMIDKHVRERGLPTDIGPNQGRFTSGVVVSPGVKAVVTAPMVAVDPSPPVAKKSVAKKSVAKKSVAKKSVAKKSAAKKTDKVAVAGDLVGHLRELGELHAAGVLDDAEFIAAKKKILG